MRYFPAYLTPARQAALLGDIRDVLAAAPLFVPTMPRSGAPFSVRMTNCGPLGWVSDKTGYRYQATHPDTGAPWPPMPRALVELWTALADYPALPEACLVNHYAGGTRMGLHRDADEDARDAPVVSVSLGDTAVFRIGGKTRRDPARTLSLASGDVVILEGDTRLAYHGIDRILPGSSPLLHEGGRFNLTLRRVRVPPPRP